MNNENNTPYSIGDEAGCWLIALGFSGTASIGFAKKLIDLGWWWVLVLLLVATGIFHSLYKAAKDKHRKAEQKKREQDFSKEINANITSGEKVLYYLYFRPFDLTDAIFIPDYDTESETNKLTEGHTEVESLEIYLGRAVYPDKFSGLGQPGETVGAIRVKVRDAEWKKEAKKLARDAKGIFLIPAYREGTIWELNYVLSHPSILCKTMFIMPPKRWTTVLKTKKFNLPKEWKMMQEELSNTGIQFPKYNNKGMLFSMSKNGTINKTVIIKDWSIINELRAAFEVLKGK